MSFHNLFSVVGEFDHWGPYSYFLIRRLTIGPSEVKVFFLRMTRLNYKGNKKFLKKF